jgi:hypothetical protein
VNPSRGGKEEAHRAWLHTVAHIGGGELAMAGQRRSGGKSLSSQRSVRHTGGAWGGIGRAGGGPEQSGHGERSWRSDGEERSAALGLLAEDGATAHYRWQIGTTLPHRLQQRRLVTAAAVAEQHGEKKMEGKTNGGAGSSACCCRGGRGVGTATGW